MFSWEAAFKKLAYFKDHRDEVLMYHAESWFEFIQEIINIENTIPEYISYEAGSAGVSPHETPLARAFGLFARAYVEEKEAIRVVPSSMIGAYLGITSLTALDSTWGYFKTGRGDRTPDLVDNADKPHTYDVKHNNSDFTKAHGANYILAYHNSSSGGFIQLHKPALKGGTYTGKFADCRNLTAIAHDLGIAPDLLNANNRYLTDLEIILRKYLGIDK